MRVCILYGAQGLVARGTLSLDGCREDPRGLTGSEYGAIRIYEILRELGHDVDFCPASHPTGVYDLAIAINEPDLLRGVKATRRVCEFWLNGFTHCRVGFDEHCDLFISPSHPHMRMVLEHWRDVEGTESGPRGRYEAPPERWIAIELGHDIERVGPKTPGRVVYLSSPDRGLHRLLEAWPAIRSNVPHATLRVFYRLRGWIESLKTTPYYPPIEKQRRRALYIEDALRRMAEHGGLDSWGVEICDSVSRVRIEDELARAEVMAYPCETVSWSEGFSCSTLEACASGCHVVVTDCDAFGELYSSLDPVPVGNWKLFAERVVGALRGEERDRFVAAGRDLGVRYTWRSHCERLLNAVEAL